MQTILRYARARPQVAVRSQSEHGVDVHVNEVGLADDLLGKLILPREIAPAVRQVILLLSLLNWVGQRHTIGVTCN